MLEFRLLKDVRCGIGESPVWDDRRQILFFIDIKAPAIHAIRQRCILQRDHDQRLSRWIALSSRRGTDRKDPQDNRAYQERG